MRRLPSEEMTTSAVQREAAAPSELMQFRRCVLAPLARLRRRLRAYLLLEGLAAVLVVAWIAAGVQFAVDRSLRLETDMRAVMLAAAAGAVFAVVWRRLIAPQTVRLPDAELALLVERHASGLHTRLVSAVELAGAAASAARPERSAAMVRMLLRQVAAEAPALPWNRPLNHQRALRRGVVVLLCLGLGTAAICLAGGTVGLWFRRDILLLDEPWPQRTRLLVEGLENGRLLCARGDDLTISAAVPKGYEVPRQVFIDFEEAGGRTGREQMVEIGRGRFQRVFERLDRAMRCRLRGGDDRTDWFAVQVVDRPAIASVVLGVEPPKYTGAAPYELREGLTAAEILKGSRITFHIRRTNKPVVSARLVRGAEVLDGRITRISETEWLAYDKPEHSAEYHFELIDAAGLANFSDRAAPTRFSIHLLPDAPPKAKLQIRGVSDMVTPEAMLPIRVDCSDTYGLAAVQLVQESTRATSAPRAASVAGFAPGSRTFAQSFVRPLAPLGLLPGDRLSLYVEARDFDDVSGPNTGTSPVVSLRVVSREELLNELTRREQQARQEFEQIVRGQEDLYADLLSALAASGSRPAEQEHRHAFARIERRQRQQSIRTDAVRRRLEEVLAEMEVNQALTGAVRERLGARVVAPMAELVRTALAETLSQLGRLSKEDSAEIRSRLQPQQERILKSMRAILADMLQYEGFQEAVSLLRDIVNLQNGVNEETARRAAEEIEKVFGPEKRN